MIKLLLSFLVLSMIFGGSPAVYAVDSLQNVSSGLQDQSNSIQNPGQINSQNPYIQSNNTNNDVLNNNSSSISVDTSSNDSSLKLAESTPNDNNTPQKSSSGFLWVVVVIVLIVFVFLAVSYWITSDKYQPKKQKTPYKTPDLVDVPARIHPLANNNSNASSKKLKQPKSKRKTKKSHR